MPHQKQLKLYTKPVLFTNLRVIFEVINLYVLGKGCHEVPAGNIRCKMQHVSQRVKEEHQITCLHFH
jgi:hypothetical protein